MSTLFGPILAVALVAQIQGRTLECTVVDDQGTPVPGAQVLFHGRIKLEDQLGPVEAHTTTGNEGRFRLVVPTTRRVPSFRAQVWVFRPGLAVAATGVGDLSRALVLHKTVPRTLKVEGPDGQPVAGARIAPRVITFAAGGTPASMPVSLAERMAVTTGPNGTIAINYLAEGDGLVAVRVATESIGTQDLQIIDRPGRDRQGAEITVRLKRTSRVIGRVRTRKNEPVVGQTVEVWFRGGSWLEPNPVVFNDGPLCTKADGSFQTSDNLLVGSPYRLVARAPGMETILSDWITIGEKPRVLLPMIQMPLRTISGRVVDRQGRPLAGIEVFQSGEGPERTATQTAADGRFALGGFRVGSVFLFARGEGFRFSGRLVKAGDQAIKIELTRTSERPTMEMRMLPDVIPLEESRVLARQILEPYLENLEKKSEVAKVRVIHALALADPAGVLRTLEAVELANPATTVTIKEEAVRALARTDPTRAEAVAESIAVPDLHAAALMAVSDALPETPADRKRALLNRAAAQIKGGLPDLMRLHALGELAERWYELGEKDRARALFSEGLGIANQVARKTNPLRGNFAARLARVDLPAAVAIAKEFPASGQYSVEWVLRNIAFRRAADDPAQAEHILRQIRPEPGQDWMPPAIAWRMASADPARARRLVDESQKHWEHPEMYLFLALGLKSRDPAEAHDAFEIAMRGIDRSLQEGGGYTREFAHRDFLLPLVEQIDPSLVAEFFWRVVATRPPLGNPRPLSDATPRTMVILLAWYDRQVAAALFEPVRDHMEPDDDPRPAARAMALLAWCSFDPRAAVAQLVKMPVNPQLNIVADPGRRQISEILGLAHEERWRQIWSRFTDIGGLWERDLR